MDYIKEECNKQALLIQSLQKTINELNFQKSQKEADLNLALTDLESAILENEKLNSEKLVDEQDKQELLGKNQELKAYVLFIFNLLILLSINVY